MTESAVERWLRLVLERRAQMDATYAELSRSSADFWTRRAERYRNRIGSADANDPLVRRVRALLPSGGTVLDVGAGTGRFALPLARYASRVIAVEPSADMSGHLGDDGRAAGLDNIKVIHGGWLEAEAEIEAADVVLCAHVLYPHAEIVEWLTSLTAHARVAVVLGLMAEWGEPLVLLDLWRRFHGSERVPQPAASDAMAVLRELGVAADIEFGVPARGPWRFESLDEAVDAIREHVIVASDPDTDAVLRSTLDRELVRVDGGLCLPARRGSASIWWRCDGPRSAPRAG